MVSFGEIDARGRQTYNFRDILPKECVCPHAIEILRRSGGMGHPTVDVDSRRGRCRVVGEGLLRGGADAKKSLTLPHHGLCVRGKVCQLVVATFCLGSCRRFGGAC